MSPLFRLPIGGTSERKIIKSLDVDMTHLRSSRRDLQHYEEWLQEVPWQLFCTFTFAWPVSDSRAIAVFNGYINRLERSMRCPIAYLRGDEKRFSGCGMPGARRHFHGLLAATCRLDCHLIANVWMDMAGHRENGAGAHVLIYDPSQGGLAYCLKFINQPGGDWDFGNLDLFLPMNREQMNKRQRRRQARHALRLSSKETR
jgi:hypothetical protein